MVITIMYNNPLLVSLTPIILDRDIKKIAPSFAAEGGLKKWCKKNLSIDSTFSHKLWTKGADFVVPAVFKRIWLLVIVRYCCKKNKKL